MICAGCNQYRYWGAFIVGISGYFIFLSVRKIIRKLKIDDVLDGVALQVGGGYWGTLGVSIFKENGLFLNPCRATAYVITDLISYDCQIVLLFNLHINIAFIRLC